MTRNPLKSSQTALQTEWAIVAAICGIGWLTTVLGLGRPDSVPWFESLASLLWIGLLAWLDHAEELRFETRARSGALARGSGEDLTSPSSRWSWLGAGAMAGTIGLTPQSLLFLPGIVAGLGRRTAWASASWRALALGAATLGLALLWRDTPWKQERWFTPASTQAFDGPGSTPIALFTLFVLIQLGFEMLLLLRSSGTDRTGKKQGAFFAASTAFLLVLSFGTPGLQQLTLWPCVAASALRAESLKHRAIALAAILISAGILVSQFLR